MIAPLCFFAHLPNTLFEVVIDFLELSQGFYAEKALWMRSALAGNLRGYLVALRDKNVTDANRYFLEVRTTVRKNSGVDNSTFISFRDTQGGHVPHQEDSSSFLTICLVELILPSTLFCFLIDKSAYCLECDPNKQKPRDSNREMLMEMSLVLKRPDGAVSLQNLVSSELVKTEKRLADCTNIDDVVDTTYESYKQHNVLGGLPCTIDIVM